MVSQHSGREAGAIFDYVEDVASMIYVGTAGWAIPKQCRDEFSGEGSILERYSRVLQAVEINSSFYRDHKPETYERWAATTPAEFRFSVKLSRYFTQEKRLRESGTKLHEVIDGISRLEDKWGVLLVQLPPSLELVPREADRFLSALRKIYYGAIAWEPRNVSWATSKAIDLLASYGVSKVIADPERCPLAEKEQRRVKDPLYFRLHGSPEIYKSQYSPDFIRGVAEKLQTASQAGTPAWCIFDNTTFGHATEDALGVQELVGGARLRRRSA